VALRRGWLEVGASAQQATAKNASAKLGRGKHEARVAARKAVVLGQVKAANGKSYQILALAAGPRRLSNEDVQQAVKLTVPAL
jgi:hypothetical protein